MHEHEGLQLRIHSAVVAAVESASRKMPKFSNVDLTINITVNYASGCGATVINCEDDHDYVD